MRGAERLSARRRVLCLTSNFPRWQGDATTPFVLHLAQDLCDLGWEVDVLAPHAPGAARIEELSGVRVERFRYLWPESAQTVCYGGGALVNLRKRPHERLKLPLLVGAEGWAAWRKLRSGHYDLLHSHWVLPQGFVGELAAQLTHVKHVVTLHGSDVFALRGRVVDPLKRYTLRRADAVTVNSSFTEAAVRQLCPEVSALERIPMGVRTEPLSASEQAEARRLRDAHGKPGGPLLVFVGRLVEEKGVGDLLDAAALLTKEVPDLRVLIVGEGLDRARFEAQAQELGLQEVVRFIGWVEPTQVRAYMAAADVFVGPSRRGTDGTTEAQGLTFPEAMAVGTAVVATRLGGIPDAVRDGETGLLVDEGSPHQIAAAIRRLLNDGELRARLTRQGEHLARERFSRSASAGAFATLFERVLQGAPAARS